MPGYEANARLTADVSQYVGASREAARASGMLGAAVRELRTDLQRMERTARSAAEAVRPFGAAMRENTSTQRQAARAADNLTGELRVNAQAFETGEQAAESFSQKQEKVTQSGRSLAQELTRTEDRLHEVQRAMALGTDSAQNLEETAETLSQRLIQLQRRYEQLSSTQQEAVDSQVQLRRAEQAAAEAGREATRTTRQLNAVRQEQVNMAEQARIATDGLSEQERHAAQMTEAALRSMAKEMDRLSNERERLYDLQRRNNSLNSEQAAALRTLEGRLEALSSQYRFLNQQQRDVVDSTRSLAQASRQSAGAVEQLGREARQATSFLEHLSQAVDNNTARLFALNAMLTDVEMGMMSVAQTAQRVGQVMFETFSAQEMGTAHLARVTQETDTYVGELAATVQDLSERIPIPFEDLARIGVLGAQVGVADDQLQNFIETVALFSATTDVAEEEASLLFARIIEMTDIEQSEIRNLGAAVSELGSNAAATEKDILDATESIATAATQAGLSETAILGLGSALASLRVQPELARGAIQRVFVDLRETANSTGDDMRRLAEIVGVTGGELASLAEQDSEEFFFRMLEGLSGLADEGENLIPILREIGIINTRDANVIAKLAGNYELLDDQVNRANTSFSEATFLQQESARLFDTLTASVETMINAWKNFLSDAVAAVAPFLISVVETGQAVAEFLSQFENADAIVGWGAVIMGAVGILGLFGAGIAGTIRAAVALRNVIGTFGGAISSYTAGMSAAATSTTATSAAMTRLTTAAGAARAAVATLGKTLAIGTVVVGTVAALGNLWVGIDNATRSTEEYNEELLKSQESHHQAAGGMEELRKALEADSEMWRRSRQAAEDHALQLGRSATEAESYASRVSDSFALRTTSTRNLTDAQQEQRDQTAENARIELEYEEAMHGSVEELKARREEMEGDTAAIDGHITKQEDLKETIEDNTREVEDQTVAVGLAVYEWQQASAESAVLETGLLKNAEAMKAMKDAGVDLGESLRIALAKEATDAGSGVEYLDSQIRRIHDDMGTFETFWMESGMSDDFLGIDMRTSAEEAADSLAAIRDNVHSTTVAIEDLNTNQEIFADTSFRMSDAVAYTSAEVQQLGQEQLELQGRTGATSDEIMEMGARAAVMDMEIASLGMTVQDLSDAFGSFVDPLQAWKQAQEEANQAVIDADEDITSLAENAEVSFEDFMDIMDEQIRAQQNWGRNLLQLSEDVPPEVIAGLSEMGAEGADLVEKLANQNDEQVDRFVAKWQTGGGQMLDEFALVYSSFLQQSMEAGDEAGREFADNLMKQYLEGGISFQEMTDELTEYAEENFQNADTENEPEVISKPAIQAMNDLTKQLERINDDADTEYEPTLDATGFWGEFESWFGSVWDWWNNLPQTFEPRVQPSVGPGVSTEGFADGGWISGRGGPRADKNIIAASDDEFVVNASSARQWGPLLEWINSQHSTGVGEMNVPNFVPEDLLNTPRRPLSALNEHTPDAALRSQATPQGGVHERVVVNVNNQYPQAEPTSTTVNRSLQYAAALDGLG